MKKLRIPEESGGEQRWWVMAVYRPQYKDRQSGKMKHTKVWYYEFVFAGRLVKESAKTTSKTVAKLAEQRAAGNWSF